MGRPTRVSLETKEAIDDIQVAFEDAKRGLIQAKRSISFSTGQGTELESVLKQFVQQDLAGPVTDINDHYYLVTTSASSKKITGDLLATLEAVRNGSPETLVRDQPKSIVSTYNEIMATVNRLVRDAGTPLDQVGLHNLLGKTRVIIIDLDPDSPLEQAVVLGLQCAGYSAPSEMWGKLISDCLEWARRRHTVDLATISQHYEHLKMPVDTKADPAKRRHIEVTLAGDGFEVGRELVIAKAQSDVPMLAKGTVGILELYRFDEDCKPRVQFTKDKLILGNGEELDLWGRFATWAGVERFLDEEVDRFKDEEVLIVPCNSDENFEEGLCAQTHRKALETAASQRDGTKCVHCELPVTSSMSPVVEFGDGNNLVFGLSHRECLLPSDRVMGRADHPLFNDHPELINFDVNAWFNSAHSGQGVFAAINLSGQRVAPVVWGGVPSHEEKAGGFVVVSVLEDGTEQITWKRGKVHRFTRPNAEKFAAKLTDSIVEARKAGDPLCYSDQSRAFSTKSLLTQQLGGKERITSISRAEARAYDARDAARYQTIGNWYAPLIVLRDSENLELLCLTNAIPAISDPLTLGRHIENWRNAGFEIPDYRIESLLTDDQVDHLIDTTVGSGVGVIIDPIFSETGELELLRGHPIYPLSIIEQQASESAKNQT